MVRFILDSLFPPRCVGCAAVLLPRERHGVCGECQPALLTVRSPKCPRCAIPRDVAAGVDSVCAACLDRPPLFDAAHALFLYEGCAGDAVRRAKGAADPAPLLGLGAIAHDWCGVLTEAYRGWNWVTPPPHRADLRRRGWDPARTLARSLLRPRKIELRTPLVKRQAGIKQARLSAAERHEALQGAFHTTEPTTGKWVVVDDVMTTGATANAVATALKRAGAESVVAIVLCRASTRY